MFVLIFAWSSRRFLSSRHASAQAAHGQFTLRSNLKTSLAAQPYVKFVNFYGEYEQKRGGGRGNYIHYLFFSSNFLAVRPCENAWGETLRPWFQNSRSRLTRLFFLNQSQKPYTSKTSERKKKKTTNTRLRDAKITPKRDFETLQRLFRDFEIGLKFSGTQVFLRSHSIPLL